MVAPTTIGFFAAPLVIRAQLSGDPAFDEALARVRQSLLEAYAHQQLPFAKVVEAARPGRESSYTPLFRVMFSLVRSLLPEAETPGLELEALEMGSGATDFDLFVNIVEEPAAAGETAPRLRGLAVYSKDVYNAETIRTLLTAYLDILAAAVGSPETRLSEFPLPAALAAGKPAPEAGHTDLRREITQQVWSVFRLLENPTHPEAEFFLMP